MSAHSSIAAVTATLHVRLRRALQATGLNADVSHARPGTSNAFPNQVGVHAFMYMATPHAALRNADLPMRDKAGRLVQRPTTALELHYLLSFVGDEAQHEPQRMLGAVASDLHANPVLAPDEIRDAVVGTELEGSRLEEQVERVRLVPVALDLEEFSKLWSVLFQTQYLLSVAYRASVVLIEADVAVRAAMRVTAPRVFTAPLPPVISSIAPQVVPPGARVVIHGSSLTGDSTVIRFVSEQGRTIDVTPEVLRGDRIEVTVPADVPAGVLAVEVVASHAAGLPARTFALASGAVPLMLVPRLVDPTAPEPRTLTEVAGAAGSAVTVDVVPPIDEAQRVLVLVGPVQVTPTEQVSEEGITRLTFVVPDHPELPPGQPAPLRVQVGRAVSLVESDGDGFRPRLVVTGGA